MEQKEVASAEKAAHLMSTFEKSFLHMRTTFHPSGIEGEISGKSSNVACAARRVIDIHHAELKMDCCNVVVTVMDADTHLSRDYFTEIRRLHYAHLTAADRSIYCCLILFDRNSHESPLAFIGINVCLSLYERWHTLRVHSRMRDMREASLPDTGCSQRVWYQPQYLLDRICFPIAGTIFGAVPTLHAVFAHFWTDRLVYRVSKKPTFSLDAVGLA